MSPLFSPELVYQDGLLRTHIESCLIGQIVDEPWFCDVVAAHDDLIDKHNEFARQRAEEIEHKFAVRHHGPCRLVELLERDFDYFYRGSPYLRTLPYVAIEIAGPSPNAHSLQVEIDGLTVNVICFRSPMLWFIHSAFSKVALLLSHGRLADCVPEHDSILKSDSYADGALFAALFNDIEVFFDHGILQRNITPEHLGSPYNYCEQVDGARRFLLGHEIGHSVFRMTDQAAVSAYVQEFVAQLKLPHQALDSLWIEELLCDWFSLNAIFATYAEAALEGPMLYELENALIGILTFFAVFDMVNGAFVADSPIHSHPPPLVRMEFIRELIKRHPMYLRSQQLNQTLPYNWGLLMTFLHFTAGWRSPDGQACLADFQQRSNDFANRAYNLLRETWANRANDETLWVSSTW